MKARDKEILRDLDALERLVERWREQGNTIVTTNGVFDLFHAGHAHFLQQCASFGDKLIVGVNSNASVAQIRKRSPLQEDWQRAYILHHHQCVDAVFIFEETTPVLWLSRIKPDVHCKDARYSLEEMPERETVESCGGRIELIPVEISVSTTDLMIRSFQEISQKASAFYRSKIWREFYETAS